MADVEIPRKPVGKFYALVLRTPDFSHGHVAAKGALGGPSELPPVVFGEGCICCSRPAEGRRTPVPLSSGHFEAEPIDAPVCAECEDHAVADTASGMAAAGFLVAGSGAGLYGLMIPLPALAWGGLVVAGLCGLWLMSIRRRRLEQTRGGHFPGIEMLIAPRQLVVRSANRALIEDLAERNRAFVFRVR